jgi:4-amino-4-deoxy-L-arabinose transferase-like glycosyltransferase
MKITDDRRLKVLTGLLFLAIVPFFINLNTSALWDANEAFYAETPRRMLETGDYSSPEFNYKPRINKPPLCYWVVTASYHLFGVSEFSERLPIALWATITIMVAYVLGFVAFSKEAGLLSAILLAATPRFLLFSRRMLIDLQLMMFMSLALMFFALAIAYTAKRKLYLILMYIAVGLGVLTKGPVALVIPALAFSLYLITTRNLKYIHQMMLPIGSLIITTIVLPWYLLSYSEHGWLYIKSFVLGDNISRFTESWGPSRGPLFYIPVLLGDLFPWSILLVPAIALALGIKIFNADSQDAGTIDTKKNIRWLLLIWGASVIGFFTLSSSKQGYYLLPSYVAFAALIGGILLIIIKENYISSLLNLISRSTTIFLLLTLLLIGVGLLYIFYRSGRIYQLNGISYIGYVLITGSIISLIAFFKRMRFLSVVVTALAIILINWTIVFHTLPDYERYRPVRPLSEFIKSKANSQSVIGYYGYAAPSMVYYLQRPVFEYFHKEDLAKALSSGNEIFCLITDKDYESLKHQMPVRTCIAASHEMFQLKWKSLFSDNELPKMLVITNNHSCIPQ